MSPMRAYQRQNVSVRVWLSTLAMIFAVYLAADGMIWTVSVRQPSILVATLTLFLAVTGLCIYWRPLPSRDASHSQAEFGSGTRLPLTAAALSLATAVLAPSASWFAAGVAGRLESFATWSLGGIGALMTIVMVRRRPWFAWIGIAVLATQSVWWIGLENALARGLVGAVMWVAAAQLILVLLARATRATASLNEAQRSAAQWLAAQGASRRERRVQVRQALAIAGPLLARAVETGGALTDAERVEARLAEGALRDELRAHRLMDDAVREVVGAARHRGSMVTILDEGGLDGLNEDELAAVRAEIAESLRGVISERVYVRAASRDGIVVTVVGRSLGDEDDEETVDLWLEIAHPERESA